MRSKISKRILSETPQETIDKVNEYSDGLILKNRSMKLPLYNMSERWEMQAYTTMTAIRKLNLSILQLRRQIYRDITRFLKNLKTNTK